MEHQGYFAGSSSLLRCTRILISLLFFIACIVYTALWVRSYRTRDLIWMHYSGDNLIRMVSVEGRVVLSIKTYQGTRRSLQRYRSRAGIGTDYKDDFGKTPNSWWFQILRWQSGLTEIHIPLWFPVLSAAILSAVVTPIRRFSLRALLIVTTLVAVILGIAAAYDPDVPKTSVYRANPPST